MVPLIIVLLLLVLVAFPVWALVAIAALRRENEKLARRTALLELRLEKLGETVRTADPAKPRRSPAEASSVSAPASTVPVPPPPIVPTASTTSVMPPALPDAVPPILPTVPPMHTPEPAVPVGIPPLVPTAMPVASAGANGEPASPARPGFDWEQFTGTKLLAWIGGAAAFLGAAFFIKYSFEHDLISPAMRVAIGYAFALALIVGGLRIPRQRYAVTAQTLCATGVVCLYAVTFACSSIYEFPAFTPARTFVLMALITVAAFLLAVRLGAQVVAVLGILGGFLTPVLLSTGRDNPFGLFGYIALLDVGLVALALHQRWLFLVPFGAAGTVAMQAGWAAKFLSAAKSPTAIVVCVVFCVIFVAAHLAAKKLRRSGPQLLWPALLIPCVAFVFALAMMGYREVAVRPGMLFGFVLAADACLLALAWLDEEAVHAHLVGGFAVFALLATWTAVRLTNDLFPWGLGLYLAHGVVHTSFPILLERHRPGAAASRWGQLFPPLALVLMLVPMFKLEAVPFGLWPCVLLVDLLAIGVAWLGGSIIAVVAALMLTMIATILWMFHLPVARVDEGALLIVVGGFAAVFFGAGIFLMRQPAEDDAGRSDSLGRNRAQVPTLSALMPFLLLIMMTLRLPVADPSGVFGLGLALVLLCFILTRSMSVAWLSACALAGVAALEYVWEARHFSPTNPRLPFAWFLVFYGVFTVFPFVFRTRFAAMTGPWAVAALSGIVQFPLIYRTVEKAWPNQYMGMIPALLAIAPLASMALVHRAPETDERARLNQIAWFGGVALFFITAIPPIQFERQWITLSWGLEGAALLWLFRRVPHPGLKGVGAALLVAAFVRLALNPAVLEYHVRASTAIFNWYLYTYGVVIVCLFVGGAWLKAPDDRTLGVRLPPLLYSLGTVLAFLLLNIEIADFFSEPGSRVLAFKFSGNLARDMTYTIAWALFALALLLVSIWKQTRAGRYAALALLGATVLKLFIHDLERLGALYRIGALFAVAIIAIVASLAYQKFQPAKR